MSKILISFIGTGTLLPDGRAQRDYRKALYKLGDEEVETSFVAYALKQFVKPDKLFLIGTPHSMWEEVYRSFCDHPDDNVWAELGEWCEKANKDTPVEIMPHKGDIEAAIGNDSKVFLIRYGINEAQIQENIDIILGLRAYLEVGDEIVVDITHSFRSLPLLIMQLILYLKQINSPKVTVSHVYYGMLDIIRDLHYAPVVDISSMIRLSDWITGVFTFKLNGSSAQATKLLKEEGGMSAASLLGKFSNVLSLNDMGQLQQQVQELSSIKYPSEMARLALEPTVTDFINRFKNLSPAEFQYRLAAWHFANGNYLAAYNDMVECIITKACEETPGFDWLNIKDRESVRNAYKAKGNIKPDDTSKLYFSSGLVEIYRLINPTRNYLVHLSKGSGSKASAANTSATAKINILKKAIADMKSEIGLHAKQPYAL
ncbi:MAG: TIGR02221 family CRISPR-associated protein [Prevotella sp.]